MDTTPEHEPFSINHVDPRQAFTMSFLNSHIMTRLPIAEMTSWSIVHHTFSTIQDYRRPFITQHLCICQVVKGHLSGCLYKRRFEAIGEDRMS
jgi:hypothetical protein